MNPFYFSGHREPIFGIYHPPLARVPGAMGFVICNPWGQEYLRAHRALRQLAINLAERGQHVLRFDYEGTGDSSGDSDACDLTVWKGDVEAAIDELKDTTGLRRVALIGLRIGGTLAWNVAAQRNDIAQVVLWEPIVSGRRYVEAILPSGPDHADSGTVDGFPVTTELSKQFAETQIGDETIRSPVLIVSSTDREPELADLAETLRGRGINVDMLHEEGPVPWLEDGDTGISGFPVAVMKQIAERAG